MSKYLVEASKKNGLFEPYDPQKYYLVSKEQLSKMILHEMKLMGIDISASLEKMYEKYGKEEFQHSAMVSGYGFILQ